MSRDIDFVIIVVSMDSTNKKISIQEELQRQWRYNKVSNRPHPLRSLLSSSISEL